MSSIALRYPLYVFQYILNGICSGYHCYRINHLTIVGFKQGHAFHSQICTEAGLSGNRLSLLHSVLAGTAQSLEFGTS